MERKHAGGAELKYNAKQFPRTARLLAARGATQDDIAECLGVSTRTLQRWIARYPELSDAIQAGNDVFNPRVERALAERAIGFWVTWDEEEISTDRNGQKQIKTVQHRKYFPPDVTAGIWWSKNRMKDRWGDVHKHEVRTQLKSSAELLEDLRKQILDLQSQGYLEGVKVPALPPPKGDSRG
jgi:hypothetical protein